MVNVSAKEHLLLPLGLPGQPGRTAALPVETAIGFDCGNATATEGVQMGKLSSKERAIWVLAVRIVCCQVQALSLSLLFRSISYGFVVRLGIVDGL